MKKGLKLAICLGLSLATGFFGSLVTVPSINSWYINLKKPVFNPPNWVFGPVWTVLFILMGISAYLVWCKGFNKKIKAALIVFLIQLGLNFLWSFVFFGAHQPLGAFIDIVLLWIAILFTIINFHKLNKLAAYLLLPYLFWVSFASILNLSIVLLN